METKTTQAAVKSIEDRTVTGLFAIHGNIDDGNDRSWPGSFANISMNGRNRTRFLWQHLASEPPVAVIKSIREVGREELTAAVLAYAPEATGGVEVIREYLDTPRSNDVLTGIKAGVIDEMSYAYDAQRFDFEEIDGKQIRNLREVKLYDISDVNWGMNPATLGSKAWSGDALTFIEHSDAVVSAIEEFTRRVKDRRDFRQSEGRDLSAANRDRIAELAEGLKAALLDLETLLKATAPKPDPAIARAFIEYQQTIAKLNGVINYAN